MPLSKLNFLHWHLSDDESFTLQLASHPELAESSAFKHGQFYTLDQAKMLIDLARKNGVTIMPEIDTPAHVRSWGLDKKWAQQNITITCPRG
jgi:hexosaminidase